MNQCREILQPIFYPEVVPVPGDEPGKAILVVRVEAQPLLQPVLCQGAAFVRVPGSTVKANRDQVIALVRRHISGGSPAPGASAMTLISGSHPPTPTAPATIRRCRTYVCGAQELWPCRPKSGAATY